MKTIGWLRRQASEHPVRSAALLCLAVTLAMVNLKLFAPGGPWWRGWSDQRLYLESARAFAAFDFDPARHWYPLPYPLAGARPSPGCRRPSCQSTSPATRPLSRAFRSIAARFGLGAGGGAAAVRRDDAGAGHRPAVGRALDHDLVGGR